MFLLCQRYAICAPDPLSIPTSVGLLVGWFWIPGTIFRFKWWGQWGTDRANPYKLTPSGRRPRVGVWPIWLQKDDQRIWILKVHCTGGWNETYTCVIRISVLRCSALLPAKSMVPRYPASLHRLPHTVFEFVLFLVMFASLFYNYCYHFWPSYLCLPSGLSCRPCPTSWT